MKYSTCNILALIMVLALVLRLPNLGLNFTGDEIDLAGPARNFLINGDFRQFNDCQNDPYFNYSHPPVRLILYSLWSSAAGFSNIALRLLPTLFGLASIALIYLLGKELYSRNVGLIAAFLAALSRYHIYASNTLNTDTGHFVFFVTLCALSFVFYKRRKDNIYIFISAMSFILAFLTKFSAILIIPPLLLYSFLCYKSSNKGKIFQDIKTFTSFIIVSLLVLYCISLVLTDENIFYQPFTSFTAYASAAPPTFNELIYNKIFYAASVSWQLTPFFAVLVIFSIFKLRRDKEFYFLASWLLLMTIAFFYTYRQDVQRFFVIALPPVFILTAKYLGKIKLHDKIIYTSFAAIFVLAYLTGLNDLMGFYSPIFVAAFYIIALIFTVPAHHKYLLIGGFAALSVYSNLPNVTAYSIGSTSVGELSQYVKSGGYPYTEVWTSKDVSFYIAPQDETVRNCNIYNMPEKSFLETNNVRYFAFYNIYEHERIKNLTYLCSDYKFVKVRGYTTGILCKVRQF